VDRIPPNNKLLKLIHRNATVVMETFKHSYIAYKTTTIKKKHKLFFYTLGKRSHLKNFSNLYWMFAKWPSRTPTRSPRAVVWDVFGNYFFGNFVWYYLCITVKLVNFNIVTILLPELVRYSLPGITYLTTIKQISFLFNYSTVVYIFLITYTFYQLYTKY